MRTFFLVLVALGALAGCSVPSLADLPLPGGAPSGPAYHVTAEFSDVLDLVPQAAVKVNDVTVGSVEKVTLSGWTAHVRLRLDKSVNLPANSTAAIRQTSLLGEKYVALDKPLTSPGRGQLVDGGVIPLSQTQRSAEVEEVLAALGLLLNGGGLAQLKTINQELGTALGGREAAAKDALNQLDTKPGRALKAYVAAAVVLDVPLGTAVLLAPYDLREMAMLGDAGANALGALLGLGSVSRLTGKRRWMAIGALAGLNLLGEQRSLGDLIERTPGLRELDRWGRPA